jgi:hypothetical protein
MLGLRLYPCYLATFMRKIIRKYPACFLPDTFGKSMVAKGFVFGMGFFQQSCKVYSVLRIPIRLAQPLAPFVISRPVKA